MRIKITIKGISPLLCNRFTDAAAMAATDGSRGSSAAADRGTPREIAEATLYLDADNKPCIPQRNIMRAIVDGGQFHKIGRKQVTTKTDSLVYACVALDEISTAIRHKQPWAVDVQPIVNPSTKGRILRYRARFDDWELRFVLTLDVSIMSAKLLRAIVDDAGKKIGLGDFRPARKGPYGRFVVVHWQEVAEPQEEPLAAAAE